MESDFIFESYSVMLVHDDYRIIEIDSPNVQLKKRIAIAPIGTPSKMYYVFFAHQRLLKDFFTLIIELDQKRNIAMKTGLMNEYETEEQPKRLLRFIKEYGMFGIVDDRLMNPFTFKEKQMISKILSSGSLENKSSSSIFQDYRNDIETPKVVYPFNQDKDFYGNIPDDGLYNLEILTQDQLNKLFPTNPFGSHRIEFIDQIVNNPRFITLQKHILENYYATKNNASVKMSEFRTPKISGIQFKNNQLLFEAHSLIEAISIIYTLDLTNHYVEHTRICPYCSRPFIAKHKQDSSQEKKYCTEKCKRAAAANRHRQQNKVKQPD